MAQLHAGNLEVRWAAGGRPRHSSYELSPNVQISHDCLFTQRPCAVPSRPPPSARACIAGVLKNLKRCNAPKLYAPRKQFCCTLQTLPPACNLASQQARLRLAALWATWTPVSSCVCAKCVPQSCVPRSCMRCIRLPQRARVRRAASWATWTRRRWTRWCCATWARSRRGRRRRAHGAVRGPAPADLAPAGAPHTVYLTRQAAPSAGTSWQGMV